MITMSHRALPRYVACVAFVALTASARAQAPVHLESDAGWPHGSVSNGALDARLAAAARQYRSYAPVPRIAFFDLAYPKDSTEAAAMNGYAVLVVTAVVQDSTELPLLRVYVRSVSGDRDLPLVARVASWLPTTDTVVRPTFGRLRAVPHSSQRPPLFGRWSSASTPTWLQRSYQSPRPVHKPPPNMRLKLTGAHKLRKNCVASPASLLSAVPRPCARLHFARSL